MAEKKTAKKVTKKTAKKAAAKSAAPQPPPAEDRLIRREVRKRRKNELKRKDKPTRDPLPAFNAQAVRRCLELLQDIEVNNGYYGIKGKLKSEGITMSANEIAEVDAERAEYLAELEAAEEE